MGLYVLSNKKNSTLKSTCPICYEELDMIELCPNRHQVCSECINYHLQSFLILDPEAKISLKCTFPGCDQNMIIEQLEIILTEDLIFALKKNDMMSKFKFPDHLSIVNCPLCPKLSCATYLIDRNDHPQFVDCSLCRKSLCLLCFKEKNVTEEDINIHKKCKSLYSVYRSPEKFMDFNLSFSCKKCKSKYIKENMAQNMKAKFGECSHIMCNQCNKNSCYFCMGHFDNVNKSDCDFNSHNIEYETNSKRCPLYMNYLANIEELKHWPQDDKKANKMFNQYKVESSMSKIISIFGKEELIEALNNFSDRLTRIDQKTIETDLSKFIPYRYLEDRIYQFMSFP